VFWTSSTLLAEQLYEVIRDLDEVEEISPPGTRLALYPTGQPRLTLLPSTGRRFLAPFLRHESISLGSQITSLTRLKEEIVGARLDEDLYDLVRSEDHQSWRFRL
jgi:hypothetical protein